MTTIMISILPDGSIPVDKINRGENGEPSCPIATKDADINAENKEEAILSANYGEAYSDDQCGNCASYNQMEEILDCIGDDSGDLGYCQIWKFVCGTEMICDKWSSGGPILDKNYRDML
tara:strand:+ start:508 stop:864 length:357 start_codon:yes stop_codon:yes gene_type:complete